MRGWRRRCCAAEVAEVGSARRGPFPGPVRRSLRRRPAGRPPNRGGARATSASRSVYPVCHREPLGHVRISAGAPVWRQVRWGPVRPGRHPGARHPLQRRPGSGRADARRDRRGGPAAGLRVPARRGQQPVRHRPRTARRPRRGAGQRPHRRPARAVRHLAGLPARAGRQVPLPQTGTRPGGGRRPGAGHDPAALRGDRRHRRRHRRRRGRRRHRPAGTDRGHPGGRGRRGARRGREPDRRGGLDPRPRAAAAPAGTGGSPRGPGAGRTRGLGR